MRFLTVQIIGFYIVLSPCLGCCTATNVSDLECKEPIDFENIINQSLAIDQDEPPRILANNSTPSNKPSRKRKARSSCPTNNKTSKPKDATLPKEEEHTQKKQKFEQDLKLLFPDQFKIYNLKVEQAKSVRPPKSEKADTSEGRKNNYPPLTSSLASTGTRGESGSTG